jgi:hypothetical protein
MSGIYEGDIKGMRIIGQNGGAHGHFLKIKFLNPHNNKAYDLFPSSRGQIYFAESKTQTGGLPAISAEYDLNKYIVLRGETMVHPGHYAEIIVQHPFQNKQFILESHNGMHIDAVRQPIYRKKISSKPKKRNIKRCKCK